MSRNAIGALLVVAIVAVGCGEPFASTLDIVPTVAANAADISYSCGGRLPFTPKLFEKPGTDETMQTPHAKALRVFLGIPYAESIGVPKTGWHFLGADPDTATFVVLSASDGVLLVDVVHQPGHWYATDMEGCGAQVVLDGLNNADWVFDPTVARPQATDRQFVALVREDTCTSEAPTARLTSPALRYEQDRILVIFGLRPPLDGPAICEANRDPTVRVLVHLDEPIGQRRVLDGGRYPPGDPTKPG